MKKILPLIMLICTISTFSQIPSYYNDVNLTLTGSALKDELSTKIISTHSIFLTYTPDVWDALKQSDLSNVDNTKVVLIYGWNDSDSDITNDYTRGKDDNGGGTGVWNREHVYSKSLANPNLGTTGPGADAHNLRPCDAQRNSSRSNRKFASGSGTASYITPEGNWYPGDEWKGDVARMMMYMYLRYGNQTLPTGVGVGNALATDSNMIDLFLQWNAEDPVSYLEIQRNPILEQLQGNRNPFIDNPAFATQIWGGPQAEDLFGNGNGNGDTEAPNAPSGLVASNISNTTVDLAWTASTDNIAVAGYQILNGASVVANTSSTNYTITSLNAGTSYIFTVKAYDAANNISVASNSTSVTTTNDGSSGNGTATELLISEYIEGSSNNKALEIANFTGTSVDLSSYSLKKATNGSGTFSSTLTLSGTLANGDVYVIANSSATTNILDVADTTNAGVMTFNGNDAVGLFKNDILIDLLGDPSSSANFAQNTTLRRSSSVVSPNTTYTTAEWDTFTTDTFDGLDTHTINGGDIVDTTAPSIPSNLIASNVTQNTVDLSWTASTDNIAVTGYDVYQNDSIIATVTENNFTVSGLNAETTYTFYVVAFDEAGNTSTSDIINITTENIPTEPTTVQLSTSFFENSWDGWSDGGSDVARYSGSRSYEGNYSIRIRDNSGTGSAMTSPVYDLTNFDSVEISFYFYSYSMESNEDFWFRYYDGNNWQTVETWTRGTDFNNNNFYTATVTLDTTNYSFVNNAQFRFQNDASGNADHIYIDQVVISGINNGLALRSASSIVSKSSAKFVRHLNTDDFISFEEDFKMYPNPVGSNGILNIKLGNNNAENITYKVISVLGKIVTKGTLNSDYIKVNNLKSGIYILEINDGEEIMRRKFVKK